MRANEADVEAINKLREQEMTAFSAADVNTLLNLVTNDVVGMPSNEPAFVGKDALRSWAENIYKQFTVQGKYTSSKCSDVISMQTPNPELGAAFLLINLSASEQE